MICCIFSFIQFNFVFISLRLLLWPIDYLEMAYLLSRCLEIFLLSFSIMIRENHLSDFSCLKVVNICFITQNMLHLDRCYMCICKEYLFCCYWLFYKCQLKQVGSQCFLFLHPWCSVNYFYELWERSSEVFKNNCGFV